MCISTLGARVTTPLVFSEKFTRDLAVMNLAGSEVGGRGEKGSPLRS